MDSLNSEYHTIRRGKLQVWNIWFIACYFHSILISLSCGPTRHSTRKTAASSRESFLGHIYSLQHADLITLKLMFEYDKTRVLTLKSYSDEEFLYYRCVYYIGMLNFTYIIICWLWHSISSCKAGIHFHQVWDNRNCKWEQISWIYTLGLTSITYFERSRNATFKRLAKSVEHACKLYTYKPWDCKLKTKLWWI